MGLFDRLEGYGERSRELFFNLLTIARPTVIATEGVHSAIRGGVVYYASLHSRSFVIIDILEVHGGHDNNPPFLSGSIG